MNLESIKFVSLSRAECYPCFKLNFKPSKSDNGEIKKNIKRPGRNAYVEIKLLNNNYVGSINNDQLYIRQEKSHILTVGIKYTEDQIPYTFAYKNKSIELSCFISHTNSNTRKKKISCATSNKKHEEYKSVAQEIYETEQSRKRATNQNRYNVYHTFYGSTFSSK